MKKSNWLVLLIVLMVVGVGGYLYFQGQTQKEKVSIEEKVIMEETPINRTYIDVSPEMAMMMINDHPELVIIDVSPKYKEGHLPTAISYYVGDGSLDKAIPSLDKNAKYLVYCHTDEASILGAQKLIDAGFTDVSRLEGNFAAWVKAGYKIEK